MKKLILFVLLIVSVGLQAQTTHTVINTNNSGAGSLRSIAGSIVSGDIIRFSPNLLASGSNTITLTSGEISFGNKAVIIKGLYNATDTLKISGNNMSRIFSFNGGGRVVLDSLVLINGNGTAASAWAGYGGAVHRFNCSDTLFVANSFLSGNSAQEGAGIYTRSSTNYSSVTITNSTISGNSGNGVLSSSSSSSSSSSNYSSVTVTNSTISGNTGGGVISIGGNGSSSIIVSNSTLSGNNGTGVYSDAYGSSSVTLIKSTISGNTSVRGGGLKSNSDAGSSIVNVINSTVSGNTASSGNGGGIYSLSNSNSNFSSVTVTNSTISGNIASGNGEGIYSISPYSSSASTITVTSSIVAENGSIGSGIYNSLVPNIISNGYNVFSDSLIGTITTDSTNITAAQLNLQALAFNGGATQTRLPGVGSIALDNGNPNDSSDAQNAPIVGVRNIGSAENCYATPTSITVSQCAAYTVPSGNNTYTQSGIYNDTLITTCGADSIIRINLTINSTTSTLSVTACNSYTSPSGNYVWTISNTYMDTLLNAANCDSIITINLTVNYSTQGTDIVMACDSLTWIDGVTYYSDNNSAIDTIINSLGCDSIVTLNLTIESVDSTVIQNMDTLMAMETGASYQWIDCNTNSLVIGAISQQFVPSITGSYKVEITKGFCVDTSGCYQVAVCDNQAMFAFIDNGAGSISFTDLSLGMYTQTDWSFGDGATSTGSNINHVYQANGNYVVVLTINDSFASNTCLSHFMDTISILGVNSPLNCQSGFSVYYDTVVGTVIVVNSSIGNNLSYSWDFGDGTTSTVQFPIHSYGTNGPFNLCLTIDDGNGCTDTFCDSIASQGAWFKSPGFDLNVEGAQPNGIGEVNLSDNLNIYPNPVHDQVNIEISNWPTQNVTITVRDMTGKLIFTKEIDSISNSETITINTSKWAKGTYFIEVADGENRVVEKIVVQ